MHPGASTSRSDPRAACVVPRCWAWLQLYQARRSGSPHPVQCRARESRSRNAHSGLALTRGAPPETNLPGLHAAAARTAKKSPGSSRRTSLQRKNKRVQGLILCARRRVVLSRQAGEKRFHVNRCRRRKMPRRAKPVAPEAQESFDSSHVRLLGHGDLPSAGARAPSAGRFALCSAIDLVTSSWLAVPPGAGRPAALTARTAVRGLERLGARTAGARQTSPHQKRPPRHPHGSPPSAGGTSSIARSQAGAVAEESARIARHTPRGEQPRRLTRAAAARNGRINTDRAQVRRASPRCAAQPSL
jgi:hypothetical protein